MMYPQLTKLYYSISEVARIAEVEQHVLRYWESQFPQLRPRRKSGGRRLYRPDDIKVVLYVKHLLYDQRYTLEGARKHLSEVRRSQIPQLEIPFEELQLKQALRDVREELKEICSLL
jgi:DNA-binding transcriptional MerR regulator